MEIILGYFAAGLIGVTLGLIGAGGSILTVPILVYCFHVEPTLATAYSLFIVGITSLVGGVSSAMKKMVDFKTAFVFSVPSFISVYFTRRYLLPFVPDDLGTFGTLIMTKNLAIMILFGFLMLTAGLTMMMTMREVDRENPVNRFSYPMMILVGFAVGLLTGLVGMGGGFLIIPALVFFARLPMKKAVGTSLVIIAAKSLLGFAGDVGSGQPIDIGFMLSISAIAITGIVFGSYASQFIQATRLKASFGWFVILVSSWILLKEVG